MEEIKDKNKLIKQSNIIILGVPHTSYKNMKIPKSKYLIDSWGFLKGNILLLGGSGTLGSCIIKSKKFPN